MSCVSTNTSNEKTVRAKVRQHAHVQAHISYDRLDQHYGHQVCSTQRHTLSPLKAMPE
jgi:hypothetical protein